MAVRLEQIPIVSQGDVDVAAIDYTDYLDSGELLASSTGFTVVEASTAGDLTLSNISRTTGATTILNRTVAAQAAMQFSISGQLTANSPYTIRVTAQTDSTPARTVIRDLILEVST